MLKVNPFRVSDLKIDSTLKDQLLKKDYTSQFHIEVENCTNFSSERDEIARRATEKFYKHLNGGILPEIKHFDSVEEFSEEVGDTKEFNFIYSMWHMDWVFVAHQMLTDIYKYEMDQPENERNQSNIDLYNEHIENLSLILDILKGSYVIYEKSEEDKKGYTVFTKVYRCPAPDFNIDPKTSFKDSKLGPALKFKDGDRFNMFFIDNVHIPWDQFIKLVKTGLNFKSSWYYDLDDEHKMDVSKEIAIYEDIIGKQDPFTPEDILKIDNVEIKTVILRYLGYDFVFGDMTPLDTWTRKNKDGKEKRHELYEVDLGIEAEPGQKSKIILVDDFSTNKRYALLVDPEDEYCNTAKGAVAWLHKRPFPVKGKPNHLTGEEIEQEIFRT